MSTAVINLVFVNDTTCQMSFLSPGEPQHGTNPYATPNPMEPVGQANNVSTVSASSNSSISGPGPQGTFQWQLISSVPTAFINVSYNHPYGTGTTTVSVSCPAGVIATCGNISGQSISLDGNTPSLQNHDNATCKIVLSGKVST